MYVSAEISYYPLGGELNAPIDRFLERVRESGLDCDTSAMSTVITGEFGALMDLLRDAMGELMEDHPSVFTLKISNACIA